MIIKSQNLTVLVVDNGSPYVKDITLCLDNLGQVHDLKKLMKNFSFELSKVILSGRRKNKKEINSINSKIIKTVILVKLQFWVSVMVRKS